MYLKCENYCLILMTKHVIKFWSHAKLKIGPICIIQILFYFNFPIKIHRLESSLKYYKLVIPKIWALLREDPLDL